MFDILNSSAEHNPKKYGQVYNGSKKQIEFLDEMCLFIKHINVINANSLRVKVKCFESWQITNIMQLWETLKSYNFPFLRTRRINQDCVENFFGTVRQQGGNCGKSDINTICASF